MASKNMMNHYGWAKRESAVKALKYLVYLDERRRWIILDSNQRRSGRTVFAAPGVPLIPTLDVMVGF
jgi:hypothetical protein